MHHSFTVSNKVIDNPFHHRVCLSLRNTRERIKTPVFQCVFPVRQLEETDASCICKPVCSYSVSYGSATVWYCAAVYSPVQFYIWFQVIHTVVFEPRSLVDAIRSQVLYLLCFYRRSEEEVDMDKVTAAMVLTSLSTSPLVRSPPVKVSGEYL